MSRKMIQVAMATSVLAATPMLGAAAELPTMSNCVKALMSRLTAKSPTPMKLLRAYTTIDSGTPLMSAQPELLLKARDAHSDVQLAEVVCTTDRDGHIVLENAPPSMY